MIAIISTRLYIDMPQLIMLFFLLLCILIPQASQTGLPFRILFLLTQSFY